MNRNINPLDINKKILITGGAGFIGYHLSKALLEKGIRVTSIDNLNDYYDVNLKKARLKELEKYHIYEFVKGDISTKQEIQQLIQTASPDIIVNLAAQAGVRYSIDAPDAYIQSNIIGFFNILECCRHFPVKHLVYASSSSVYGANTKVPFSTDDKTDTPVSLYAATKKSDEMMAYCYSKLYNIPCTGLRFFTVYGPFGRPDMAYYKFAQKIMADEKIQIYNKGDMLRDFTYIDDIVDGVENILGHTPDKDEFGVNHKIYNIGNNKPVRLMDFIETLENNLGKKAIKEYLPMQPGDVYQTYADITDMTEHFGFQPKTDIKTGVKTFVDWFCEYSRANEFRS